MKKKFMLSNYLLVGFGGFVGANLRYAIGKCMNNLNTFRYNHNALHMFDGLDCNTLFVNIIGSFIAGILAGFFVFLPPTKVRILKHMRLFVMTGLCGGLTTFSTFSHGNLLLFQSHMIFVGFFSIFANVILSLLFFAIAYKMFRIITKHKKGATE